MVLKRRFRNILAGTGTALVLASIGYLALIEHEGGPARWVVFVIGLPLSAVLIYIMYADEVNP